ncbi:MAG: DedA family protein [Mycobacteriales bacterium]
MIGPVATASSAVALNVLSPTSLLSTLGAVAVLVVLFAETGLLVGFFLPGDSLLFSAGVLSATTSSTGLHLNLAVTLLAGAAGALTGAQTGYLLGVKAGRPLLDRSARPRLRGAVRRAEVFLERYGVGKALVLSRFVPVVRTVINPLAGISGVDAAQFLRWQVIGGLLWSVGVTLAGYGLGASVHNIDHYLLPIIGLVIVLSLIPVALELRRSRREKPLV